MKRGSSAERSPVPVVVIDGTSSWRRWLLDLYLYRGALKSLARRNVRSRYKQATLGMAWAVIQPVAQVGVFTLLFGILARVPSGGAPYPLFALAGLLPWNLFSKTISDGAPSLVVNQHMINKLFFPRIYLVIASSASALLDAVVTAVLMTAVMLWFAVSPGANVWLAIPALLGVLMFGYGLAALLASANARWRDVQHTTPFLLQLGLFVTPVVYHTTFIPERWRWLLALNPLTGFIETFRAAVLDVPAPEPRVLITSLTVAMLTSVLGLWQFRRSEAAIVDVV